MAYKALYRTYRPSTFDEVAGQQHIVKTLKNALATNKIAHAYLFAGPRGTGKTTMARILAKALNCEEGQGCQCNQCKNCLAVNDGSHPDIIEIDGASNNGVEEIRDLIDKIKYGTSLGRKKVYIIDEVHMITTQAFNALLKTLEEPPEHVVFILATTEPHKIIPTILSRCQRYDFTRVSDEDIKNRIKVILEQENIPYNENAVKLIVALADGGMRDALSILDQVLAYSGNSLNEQDILDIFSLESVEEKISLLRELNNYNINVVLQKLSNYIAKGTDIKRLTNDLMLILKDILIFESSANGNFLEILKENQARELSREFNSGKVLNMIDVLMGAIKEFKTVTDINSFFEVTLLKLCAVEGKTISIPAPKIEKEEPVVTRVEEVKVTAPIIEEVKPVIETPAPAPVIEEKAVTVEEIKETTPVPQPEPVIEQPKPAFDSIINTVDKAKILDGVIEGEKFSIDDEMIINIMVSSKKEIKNQLGEAWEKLKKFIAHPQLGKAATLLLDAHLLVASNKAIIVEFPLSNTVDKANNPELQKDLQSVCTNVFGIQPFVYAVSRNDSIRLQKHYMDLMQLGKLPKAINITLKFKGE